jgi:hypothetical protein
MHRSDTRIQSGLTTPQCLHDTLAARALGRIREKKMHTPSTLAWAAIFTLQGIMVLAWSLPCGALAIKGEKAGIGFWKTFLVSFFMTPIAGMLMILMARPNRVEPQTVSRGTTPTSLRVSS